MDENIIDKRGKKNNNVGHDTEQTVMDILKTFNNVKKVWKDTSNSKFDLYYVLEDGETRGLQVKSLLEI